MAYFTDHEIIEMILKEESRSQNAAIEQLYHQNEKVITQLVFNKGGNKSDARDLFQDMIIIFLKKVRSGEFLLNENAKISTYLYAIAINLSLKRNQSQNSSYQRNLRFLENQDQTMPDDPDPLDLIIEKEMDMRSLEIFKMLDYNDQELLRVFIEEKLSMEEIAVRFGYENADTAKNRKYRAVKKLGKIMRRLKLID